MTGRKIKKILKVAAIGTLAVTVAGFVVTELWNWLVPAVFGGHAINFWQAIGLFFLSRILFGGFRGGGPRMHWRRRVAEHWDQMTPEEREKVRHWMRGRGEQFGMPEPDAKV